MATTKKTETKKTTTKKAEPKTAPKKSAPKKAKKVAAYCMTRNLYRSAVPSIKSLLKNSDVDEIYLLIEDDKFPYDLPKIKAINVSEQQYFAPGCPNYYGTPWTYMAMMRATLCYYIKADRVLSLDIDTIIDGDISELWNLPSDDYYLAGGKEPDKSYNDLYVNAGVIMYNLKKLRDGMADKVIDSLNHRLYGFAEQDAFNELCRGQIYELDPKYNVHLWSQKTEDEPVIVHHAGFKPEVWMNYDIVKKYDAMEIKK